jgi:hypothetical protein
MKTIRQKKADCLFYGFITQAAGFRGWVCSISGGVGSFLP